MKRLVAVVGALCAVHLLAYGLALQWVFFHVWGNYGYWVWVSGGSSSGSW